MLNTENILSMSNDELYEVYRYGIEHKDLKLINSVRSVIADRYSLKALKQSPLDNWRNNKDIARFFDVKL